MQVTECKILAMQVLIPEKGGIVEPDVRMESRFSTAFLYPEVPVSCI